MTSSKHSLDPSDRGKGGAPWAISHCQTTPPLKMIGFYHTGSDRVYYYITEAKRVDVYQYFFQTYPPSKRVSEHISGKIFGDIRIECATRSITRPFNEYYTPVQRLAWWLLSIDHRSLSELVQASHQLPSRFQGLTIRSRERLLNMNTGENSLQFVSVNIFLFGGREKARN